MMAGMLQDQKLENEIERQMGGCIAGFFNIFDRHHSLAAKRLPPPSSGFRRVFDEADKTAPARSGSRTPAAEPAAPPSEASSPGSPLALRTLEFKECTRSPWKFCKEAPRLSLDSRAVTGSNGSLYPREIRGGTPDGGDDGRQKRSPSVVARLMGLENLPRANPQPANNAELRRSASESRVNKDLYRFVEGGNHFQQNQLQQQQSNLTNSAMSREGVVSGDVESSAARNTGMDRPMKVPVPQQGGRRTSYNSADYFAEPKKRSPSIYEEVERRLRMRGVDEPSRDLETLKQILDALQLKGLLHAKRPAGNSAGHQRSFVYENGFEHHSPIVLMKPSRSSNRSENKSPPSSFRSRPSNFSPTRCDSSSKSPGRRRQAMSAEQKKVSPVQSPRFDQSCRARTSQPINSRMPKARKQVVEVDPAEDESSTLSESSSGTPPQADIERTKAGGYKEGRSLLERCDKLLHSIAEMTGTPESSQPSPVSVLDAASFYKDETSPSPVKKRSIDFIKDESGVLDDDDLWSVVSEENPDDADFAYISDIVRALSCLPEDSNAFLLLEKRQHLKGKDTSRASRMQRKLIFDTVTEILERKRQLPTWTSVVPSSRLKPLVQQVWSEFRLIRERDASEEDLLEVICGVLRKDLTMGDAIDGWGTCPVEVSESVLDVERLIFKDMIGEAIGDLVRVQMPRRRLIF